MTPDITSINVEFNEHCGTQPKSTPATNTSDFANTNAEFDEYFSALSESTPATNISDFANINAEFDEFSSALTGNSPATSTTTPDPWNIGSEVDDHYSGFSGDTLTCSSIMTPDPEDIVDANAVTTLFHAVLSGDANEVRALSSDGMYISPLDSWIIIEACLQGPDMIQAFCSNPWVNLSRPLAGLTGSPLISYLLQTSASRFPRGKRDTISAVLQQTSSPVAYDHLGNHALHVLADSLDPEASDLMKLFLSRADGSSEAIRAAYILQINSRNWPIIGSEFGNTPLTLAVIRNNIESVQLLLENGADPVCPGEFD